MTATIPTCDRCGHPHVTPHGHQACAGHVSRSDPLRPCRQPPVTGSKVCRSHGAAKGTKARAAADRRAAEAAAAAKVATLGLRIDISPTEALLQEVQWTAGHVQWLRGKVQDLGEGLEEYAGRNHPLVWGTTKTGEKHSAEKGTETSVTESAEPSIWYVLYAKERDHLVAVCAAALKAGVEERRVRLAEQQGDLVVEAIRRILDALDLSPEQQARVPEVVPATLRLIAGGAA